VNSQRLLTLLEVADLLRLSPHTIRAMVRKGRLQSVRICRRLLFSPDEITRLLAQSQAVASSVKNFGAKGVGCDS
jgi:excisionase family DNA binding protein